MATNGVSASREPRLVSSHRGRDRGGGRYAASQQDPRGMVSKARSSEPSQHHGYRGKHGGGGRSGRGGRGQTRTKAHSSWSGQRAVSKFYLLPEDIVTQSLLPFFVWHDTSAVACVCKPWSTAVRHVRQQHSEWKTHAFQGDNARECISKLSRLFGRGAHRGGGSVRFPPTFALATLSFADVHTNARYTESFWSDLVDAVVNQDVLSVGCVLVGLLCGHRSHGIDEDSELPAAPVVLTISIGHFANTTVETAAFDRKALRWSASGLTEELECPFARDDPGEADPNKTSLLLWSKNAKPAQALLELSKQWFPHASVGGGVLSLGDHAPPLMTFTRTAQAEPKRSKLQARRKPKTTTLSGGGVLSCPSTLLVRLRGNVSVKPFSLCLDRPITPVLKNVEVAPTQELDLRRQECRLYRAVTVVDNETNEARDDQSASLGEVISELTRSSSQPLVGLKLYTSASPQKLRAAFTANSVGAMEAQGSESYPVRPLPLFMGDHGALTFVDHWSTGHCGVVTMPYSDHTMARTVEVQMKKTMEMTRRRVVGAFVAYSKETRGNRSNQASEALGRALDQTPCHESAVDDGIAPLSLPSATSDAQAGVLVNTTTGFLVLG